MSRRRIHSRPSARDRRGAVTVEFAFMAPLFVAMLIGMTQVCHLLQVQNHFATAVREGARLALHDREGMSTEGLTTNQKIERDIRTFLNANAMPGDTCDIFISEVGDRNTPFDLDDPDNELEYFQVIVEHSPQEILGMTPPVSDTFRVSARIVFRNGRVPNVQ